MPPSMGFATQLGIGSDTPVTTELEFQSANLGKVARVLDSNGIRGTRSIPKERVRDGIYEISGSISLTPSPAELDAILPWITGTAKDESNQFPLAESLLSQYVSIDRVAKVFTYGGCVVSRATFRGSEGSLLQVTLDIEGKTETIGNAGTFPSLTLDSGSPYTFTDAVLTIGGTPYQCREFELVIDNQVRPRHMNSLSRTEIPAARRMVTTRFVVPYTSSETSLYSMGVGGAAASLVLTNGAYSISFAFANIVNPATGDSIAISGPDEELFLTLSGQARSSGSTKELIITNDSTA